MQSQNTVLDAFAKAMQEAAGAADGVRREAETVFRSQMQRFLAEADLVQREEFEALRDMVMELREENARLKERIGGADGEG